MTTWATIRIDTFSILQITLVNSGFPVSSDLLIPFFNFTCFNLACFNFYFLTSSLFVDLHICPEWSEEEEVCVFAFNSFPENLKGVLGSWSLPSTSRSTSFSTAGQACRGIHASQALPFIIEPALPYVSLLLDLFFFYALSLLTNVTSWFQ